VQSEVKQTQTQNREYECLGKSYGSKLVSTSLQPALFVDTQTATRFVPSVVEKMNLRRFHCGCGIHSVGKTVFICNTFCTVCFTEKYAVKNFVQKITRTQCCVKEQYKEWCKRFDTQVQYWTK